MGKPSNTETRCHPPAPQEMRALLALLLVAAGAGRAHAQACKANEKGSGGQAPCTPCPTNSFSKAGAAKCTRVRFRAPNE